jgi:hypothetical protein
MHISKIRNCGNCNNYVNGECHNDSPSWDASRSGVWPSVRAEYWCNQWEAEIELCEIDAMSSTCQRRLEGLNIKQKDEEE